MSKSLRFLRPYLQPRALPVSAAARAAHLRFYTAVQPQAEVHEYSTIQQKAGDVEQGLERLGTTPSQLYPRVKTHNGVVNCNAFAKRYGSLKPGESQVGEVVEIHGMLGMAPTREVAHASRKDTQAPSTRPKASIH